VNRRIVGFHRDEEGDWVADLACGHGQHVRHQPPFVTRPWVLTEEGRAAHLGRELNCLKCEEEG
jgi:cytochrome c-type biogenesis protein CcmH/NrfF